nr:MAG TPA: hypothetical protein [Caudoviricetes sp.]
MKTIREQVTDFMEHNEQLTKLKDENWYKMEDSLVALIESITHKKDTTYTDEIQVQLADGNYVTLVNGNYMIEILDDFRQVMESFDINIKNQTKTEIINQLQQLDKYEYMDRIFTSYDYEEDYHRLMKTYFEDIIFGNGVDAVEQEIKEIKKDLETMSEKEFCENYGIFKIGNMYFRS